MKIYTKKGDQGKTSLVDGTQVDKTNSRLNAYGTLDELNSHLGLLLSHWPSDPSLNKESEQIALIQSWLFQLGSQLACADSQMAEKLPTISQDEITVLEKAIDAWTEELPPLKNFILPGGHLAASQAHICRTVCRRAERRCGDVKDLGELPAIPFLNRLSDYLFVLARVINFRLNISSTDWIP